MPTFQIPATYTIIAMYRLEADSVDDAVNMARSANFPPEDEEIDWDSLVIDETAAEEIITEVRAQDTA